MYRHVDALNEAGIPAAVLHDRPDFRCTWFDHRTRVVAPPITFGDDVLVFPEQFSAEALTRIAPGVPKVVLNQNAYRTFTPKGTASKGSPGPSPSIDCPDVVATIVVSQDSLRYLQYAFPQRRVHLVRHWVDGDVFFPDFAAQDRRIAVMPHKRPQDFAQVRALLERRGVLATWELVVLRGVTETEVARQLRRAPLFLHFPNAEGFGLPAAEAIASGCSVIGFHGQAGREYLRPPHATVLDEGDVVGLAMAVEEFTRRFEDVRPALAQCMADASDRLLDTYSRAHQIEDLVAAFGALESRGRQNGATLVARDLQLESGLRRTARRVAVRVGRVVVR
jgi:glycosyltransferase involved in cell wall biosynthesis